MKVLGNIIWMIFGGLFSAIGWFLLGLILCITIIGIPFGKQCFKVSKLMLAPFGKRVDTNFSRHPVINVIWAILFGWEMALSNILCGVVYCITIIGIPFGKQWFKFAKLSFIPFGAVVERA